MLPALDDDQLDQVSENPRAGSMKLCCYESDAETAATPRCHGMAGRNNHMQPHAWDTESGCWSPSRSGVPSMIWTARSTDGAFKYVTSPSPFTAPLSSLPMSD